MSKDINIYKKIFRTKRIRKIILNLFSFVPDKIMLRLQYFIKLRRKLNLRNPKRFTEKIQKYKLTYKNKKMIQCVDKYRVREYVKSKGLEKNLVDLYGVYDSIENIDFELLPDSFVIKTNNGSGGLNILICRNKSDFNFNKINTNLKLEKIKSNTGGREWPYYYINPKLIIEELLEDKNSNRELMDYKIFCYNGEPKYIIVDIDRYSNHKRDIFDIYWRKINLQSSDIPSSDNIIEKPKNFEEMLKIAKTLSEDFPFVRVDLYNLNGVIYFGELTFYPWSGYVQFNPDRLDYMLGEHFEL